MNESPAVSRPAYLPVSQIFDRREALDTRVRSYLKLLCLEDELVTVSRLRGAAQSAENHTVGPHSRPPTRDAMSSRMAPVRCW
jgi:hypothetical protein